MENIREWNFDAKEWCKANRTALKNAIILANPELTKREASKQATEDTKEILTEMRNVYGFVVQQALIDCKYNHDLDSFPTVAEAVYDNETWRSIFSLKLQGYVDWYKEQAA